MKIEIANRGSVNIDNSLLPPVKEKRNTETSYLNEFFVDGGSVKLDADFLFRLTAYYNISEYCKKLGYGTNFELFGGVGITGKIFQQKDGDTYLNDIDEKCLNILRDNFLPENVLNIDAFNLFIEGVKFDLIVGDFNDFTLNKFIFDSKYSKALDNIFNMSNKFVVLNDCSVFYLRYGEKSYEVYRKYIGGDFADFETFLGQCKKFYESVIPGWKMVKAEYFQGSTIILFQKSEEDLELDIQKVVKKNLINFIVYEL